MSSKSGKIGLIVIGCIFVLFSVPFYFVFGSDLAKTLQSFSWSPVPAKITLSRIEYDFGNNAAYEAKVYYSYKFENIGHSKISSEKYSQYLDAYEKVVRFPTGITRDILVNPDKPGEALLERSVGPEVFALVFPFLFTLIGAGLIAGGVLTREKSKFAKKSSGINFPFNKIFLLVALVISYFLLVRPGLDYIEMTSWKPVEAVVENSRLQTFTSDDGTTYKVDILYKYSYGGQDYLSNRYKMYHFSTSGRSGKKKLIKEHPRGKKITVYVNPNYPAEAVVERSIGLIPIIAGTFASGFFILIGVVLSKAQTKEEITRAENEHYELKTKSYHGTGAFVCTLVGGGMITALVLIDNMETIPMVILSVMSVFLTLGAVYNILALGNPKPKILVKTGTIRLGEEEKCELDFAGNTSKISKLTVLVEGVEEATYRRGTNTYTDKNTFYSSSLVEQQSVPSFTEFSFMIPKEMVPGFDGGNNKIVYYLSVHGDIPRWPDIKAKFRLEVEPCLS